MTREMILRECLETAQNNLSCYSKDYLRTTPKDSYETEHKEAATEVEMLKVWLKEIHSTNMNSTVEFISHVNVTSYGRTYDGRPLAKSIEFEVDTGTGYLYGDRRIFNLGPEVQDWFIGDNGHYGRYDCEKDQRSSRLMKITVDHIMYIRTMEWAEENEWT